MGYESDIFFKIECQLFLKQMLKDKFFFFLFITMTLSQSLSILSGNRLISVERNFVLLLFFSHIKDKILLCYVMNCQTSPSTTTITLQLKKTLPKSIITINMCALQNHSACYERHRSPIDNVSSLHFVLKPQKQIETDFKLQS